MRGPQLQKATLAMAQPYLAARALAISENMASASVPSQDVTVKAGTLLAAGKIGAGGAVSATVAALTEGVVKGMLLTKLKIGTVVLLGATVIVSSISGVLLSLSSAGQTSSQDGLRGDAVAKSPDLPQASPRPAPAASGGPKVSATALMNAVYDSFAWVDSARTFRIRTEYKISHTDEERHWQDKQPQKGFFSNKVDPRPFCVKAEWAWGQSRIYRRTQSYYQGETDFNQQTRIWDGVLAMECLESGKKKDKQLVLANKASRFVQRTKRDPFGAAPLGAWRRPSFLVAASRCGEAPRIRGRLSGGLRTGGAGRTPWTTLPCDRVAGRPMAHVHWRGRRTALSPNIPLRLQRSWL